MVSKDAIDRVCGVLLILLPIALIASIATGSRFETHETTPMQSLQTVVDNHGLFVASTMFLFVTGLVSITLAAAMYLAFRTHETMPAMFGSVWLLGVGVTLMVGATGGFALGEIADEFKTAGGGNMSMIATSARPMQLIFENSPLFGFAMLLPLSLLIFGALIVRRGAVPRAYGWAALVIGVLIPAFWVGLWPVGMIGLMLAGVWHLILGGWILARGTREAPSGSPADFAAHPAPAPSAGNA